ncbi:hypothetical protein BDW74DRAFT_63016 [Aspergillus multicolor]|uniref:uncharacterized protein n=1 Tax=Aspergillus multicolor TaxID=41759 RepID=UPI003CCE4B73
MTDIMNSYFHHLRTFTIAQSYPLDAPRMKIWWWQKALSEPAIQQALLCSAASHQTALNTLNGVAPQYMRSSVREFLRLRGDTIKTLNGRLRDPGAVAESTILIVASLRAIEAISASVDGVTAHTKGLEILINLYGGLDALEHLTVSKIYHGDIIRAALTNTPTLPLTPKWRAEILQELKLFGTSTSSGGFLSMLDPQVHKQLSRLGSSFLAGPWYTMLPETMQSTLMISQRLIQYYEAAQIYPTLIKPTDNDLFVVLMHRLVSDPYTETQTNGNGRRHGNGRSINDPLRFALLIYLNTRVWHLQSFPIMARLVGTLQGSLLAVTATFDIIIGNGTADAEAAAVGRSKPQSVLAHLKTLAPSLTFWILFIGAMASHGHAGHCWFLAQLADCTLDLGLDGGPGGWMAARDILEGFFYTEQKDEVGGEEVWSEVCVLIQARAALEPSATARSVKDEDEVFGVGVSGGGGFGL